MNDPSQKMRLLTFTLNQDLYGVNIYAVREILDLIDITRIPHAPAFMRGLINLRGKAVPVMDLHRRFGLLLAEKTVFSRIIILEILQGKELVSIGVLADAVREVLELDHTSIASPPPMGTKIKAEFISGIAQHRHRFIILLDIDTVFALDSQPDDLPLQGSSHAD